MNRAFTHDPTTFSYEVMTTSNIGWRAILDFAIVATPVSAGFGALKK